MADQLPVYEKSVRLEIANQPDTDSAAQNMINAFRNFSNATTEITGSYLRRESEERRDIIKNNISTAYRQFGTDALLEPDQQKALSDYDQKATDYGKGLLNETDPFNKAYVKNLLDYYSNEHRTPIIRDAVEQTKRVQQIDFIMRDNRATDDVLHAIQTSDPKLGDHQFDAATSLHTQQIQFLQQQAVLGNISPSAFDSAVKTYRKQFMREVLLKKYKDAVAEGKAPEFLKSLVESSIEGFDENDKASVFLSINKINDQHLTELGLSMSGLNEQKKKDIKAIEDSGALPNVKLLDVVKQVQPAEAEKYRQEQEKAQTVWSIKQAAAQSTPAQIEELKKQLRPTDPNEPQYMDKLDMYNRAFNAVDKQRTDYYKDPMASDQDQPFIQKLSRDYQLAEDAHAVGTPVKNSALNEPIQKPWDSIIQHQQAMGLSIYGDKSNRVRLLTDAQAREKVAAIEQANPREKIALFNQLHQQYDGGIRYNLVIKQLADAGLNSKLQFLGLFQPDDPQAQDIADAMTLPTKDMKDALTSKNKVWADSVDSGVNKGIYNDSGTSNFKSYMKSTAAYAGGKSEDYLNSVQDVVQSLAYHYLNIGKENTPEKAVARAQDTLANRYEYINIHDQIVNVPKGYTPQIIKDYALKREEKLKDFPFKITESTQGGALRPEQAAALDRDLIMKGHWVGGSNDNGLVWVDFNGRLPTDKEGHPFYFAFQDAEHGFDTAQPHQIQNALPTFIQKMAQEGAKPIMQLLGKK